MKEGIEHMQQIVELLDRNIIYVILGLIGMSAVFLILIIILFLKNRKLKKKYNSFMRGTETNIEGLLMECIKKTDDVQDSYKYIRDSVAQTQMQLKKCIQKVGIVRYSAVSGVGADLSFAIALLDEEDNGVVVNGIYTRDGSYTYAKQIITGKSKHLLSDEENEAIINAKQLL